MTYIKNMLPWMTIFILIAGIQSAGGQSSEIDENRMNRDLRIMENVLQELFKTGGTIRGRYGGPFGFGNNHNIRGTYLPGYGVIFTIPEARPGFMALGGANGNDFSFYFEYGDGEKGEKVTEESITERIIEFLQDYGAVIGQLSDKEKVMVIYNTAASSDRFDFDNFRLAGEDEDKEQEKRRQDIPTISVAAAKSDLQAYRSGDASPGQLRERLEISTGGVNDDSQMDLKVMANILETTLKESVDEGTGSFRISGSLDYLMLDNFGALFFGNAISAGGLSSAISSLNLSNIDSISVQPRKKKGGVRITTKSGEQRFYGSSDMLEGWKKRQEQRHKQMEEHYRAFVSRLKESLVDYGRTLRSIDSDQYILLSVALNSRLGPHGNLPERIDMQVKKSMLEAMERGDLDREDTIDQIQVREY
ncbi:hypothetical protein SAMN05443144_11375 [Fodinibius roseus]|uniref:Uncharacterized protein n=1 Tax=Fodinibius roseus TaxID=1194090 RepID=A0A1M5EIY3_9BACT|nr:hypothetical protein [Fodinibius roseus]SHF79228.1 hypothetical protein SAMN05443144_11375 [Fodinibius roseus]